MRIAIVNSYHPFIYGGAEFLAEGLKKNLLEHGHQAVLVKIPFQWEPPQKIIEHLLAARLLHFASGKNDFDFYDLVIPLKFPAYCVNHPNKVLWLLHQFRQVYDLWGTDYQSIPDTPTGRSIKETITRADNLYLNEAKKIYTIAQVVSNRLKKYNGIDSEVLYHPLINPEIYYCGEYGDYIFYPSRLGDMKRQHLVVESMKYVKSGAKLIVVGNPDSPAYLELLHRMVDENNLSHKVKIIGEFISEEYKAELFANSLGCTYVPYDEDSYGYVTLEAYHSRKPVITCTDSGGTHVVVKDNMTGFVVSPDAKSIAEAIDKLYFNKKRAMQMGNQGFEHMNVLGINWNTVIERLLK